MTTRDEVLVQRAELDWLLEVEATAKVDRHLWYCIDSNSPLNRMTTRMIRAMRNAKITNVTILAVIADEGRIEALDKDRYGR